MLWHICQQSHHGGGGGGGEGEIWNGKIGHNESVPNYAMVFYGR